MKRYVEGDRKVIVVKVVEFVEKKGYKIDIIDGIKIIFDDGWVFVRVSGIELIIRIFSEVKSEEKVREYFEFGIKLFEEVFKG